MPHLTLEYTANLQGFDAAACLAALNEALLASGQFEGIDVKSRAIALDTFRIGREDGGHAFLHAKAAILSGRSLEIRQALSAALLAVLQARAPRPAGIMVQLCAQVDEIERASYAKAVIGPAG